LRDAWPHEANDFTPWLAESENLSRLSDELGIPLVLEDTEAPVPSGRVDILAINEYDNSTVLIEDQLDVSDHKHLGQIMSYIVNIKPKTVVWIAKGFRKEHLKVVQYMNEKRDGKHRDWFAVQVSVQKIAKMDDSPLIPKFKVVGYPSGWGSDEWRDRYSAGGVNVDAKSLSERGKSRVEFWKLYEEKHPKDNIPKPTHFLRDRWAGTNTWDNIDTARLTLSRYISATQIGVFFRKSDKNESDDDVEKRIPRYDDEFQRQFSKKPSDHPFEKGNRRMYLIDALDIDAYDRDNWNAMVEWFHEKYHICLRILEEHPQS